MFKPLPPPITTTLGPSSNIVLLNINDLTFTFFLFVILSSVDSTSTSKVLLFKNIKPRIIAEEYIGTGGDYINDYKLFCFDGEPKAILIANGRFVEPETYFDYFDMDFNHFPFKQGGPNYHSKIEVPPLFNEMKDIAKKLSKGLAHVRIDLYEFKGKLKFGEITFFDSSGFEKFEPKEWAVTFGDWIKLPNNK